MRALRVSSSLAASMMCASPITRSRKRRSRPTWQRRSAGPHRRRQTRHCRTFRSRRRHRSSSGTVNLAAAASDNVGVVGVKFLLDGNTTIGAEDTTSPYGVSWNTTTVSNGTHTLAAQARDAANNVATSTASHGHGRQSGTDWHGRHQRGSAATNSKTVTLALTATDAVTSVTQMRFSNNGTSFSTAEAFAPTKTWTLSNGAGTKTVYAQFRDAAGNWSTAATNTIVLDTTAPTISGRTATNITGSSARITWTTNEAATSRVEYGLTTSYGSSTTLDSTLVTAHSVAMTGLAPNTTYNYRVRSIDAAGNQQVSANSTFKTAAAADTMPPSTHGPHCDRGFADADQSLLEPLDRQCRGDGLSGPSATERRLALRRRPPSAIPACRRTRHTVTPCGQWMRPPTAPACPPRPAPRRSTPDTTYPQSQSPRQRELRRFRVRSRSAPMPPTTSAWRGVTFLVDNVVIGGGEDTTSPYSVSWDTTTVLNGVHTIVARARDTSNNSTDCPRDGNGIQCADGRTGRRLLVRRGYWHYRKRFLGPGKYGDLGEWCCLGARPARQGRELRRSERLHHHSELHFDQHLGQCPHLVDVDQSPTTRQRRLRRHWQVLEHDT